MLLVVDFGSQTAHLITRRLKDLGATVVLVTPETAEKTILTQHPQGIILSGGPASVYETGAPSIPLSVLKHGIPVLGICYGWQLMAQLLGGEVRSTTHEYGPEKIHWSHAALGIEAGEFTVIVSHGDSVTQLPEGFEVLGSTEEVAYAAVAHPEKNSLVSSFTLKLTILKTVFSYLNTLRLKFARSHSQKQKLRSIP